MTNKARRNRRRVAKNMTVNKSTPKRIMVHCSSLVDKSAVSREIIEGVEHIRVTSKTLPDNIVMNGIFYPAEEIEKSFLSLDGTLAPIEHPVDPQGNFLSAVKAAAIHNFHGGASNENVRQENGRVVLDKVVNVQEALKSERGKRLLDRINELETSADPRPVHTSTGVFMNIEELSEPKINALGQEYQFVGSDFDFDHDAILLDSVAAAQPHQGVGMAVNSKNEKIDVFLCNLDEFEQVQLDEPIKPEPKKGDAMKEAIVNALKDAGVETDGLDDAAVLEAYNELHANRNSDNADAGDNKAYLAELVANQIKPLTDELANVKAQLNAEVDKELTRYAEMIANSDKYPDLDAESAKKMGLETLKILSANCGHAYQLSSPNQIINNDKDEVTFHVVNDLKEVNHG